MEVCVPNCWSCPFSSCVPDATVTRVPRFFANSGLTMMISLWFGGMCPQLLVSLFFNLSSRGHSGFAYSSNKSHLLSDDFGHLVKCNGGLCPQLLVSLSFSSYAPEVSGPGSKFFANSGQAWICHTLPTNPICFLMTLAIWFAMEACVPNCWPFIEVQVK